MKIEIILFFIFLFWLGFWSMLCWPLGLNETTFSICFLATMASTVATYYKMFEEEN